MVGQEALEIEKLIQPSMEVIGKDKVEFSHTFLANKLESEKLSIEKARSLFDKIPNSNANKPSLANKIGVILFASGSPGKASEYFRRALVLTGTNNEQRARIESNLFHALLNKENYEAALSYMMQSLELGSEDCDLFDIDRYVPKKILGAGGMGVTFLCDDEYDEKEVVVKTLWRNATGTIKEVFSEALISKKINDSRVLDIYEIRRHKGSKPYIVMEYFEGVDLNKYIEHANNQPLPFDEVLDIMLQVSQGISAAHNLDTPIVHRDIKPSNILYNSKSKKVKLIDFGIACMLPNAKEISSTITVNSNGIVAKKMLGTLGYMAPEQQRGENTGTRADVFSLGKTFMFLLTAKTPPTENIMAISNPNIRRIVGEFIGRCLMPEATERCEIDQVVKQLEEIKEYVAQYGYDNVPSQEEPEELVAVAMEADFDDGFEPDPFAHDYGQAFEQNTENVTSEENNLQNPPLEEPSTEQEHLENDSVGETFVDSVVIEPYQDLEEASNPSQEVESLSSEEFDLGKSVIIDGAWGDEPEKSDEITSHIAETSEHSPINEEIETISGVDELETISDIDEIASAEELGFNDEATIDFEQDMNNSPQVEEISDLGFAPEVPATNTHHYTQEIQVQAREEKIDLSHLLSTISLPDGFTLQDNGIICQKDSSLMIYIPEGSFLMGFDGANTNEKGEHQVSLGGYLIDQCPVSWLQYHHFCDITNRDKPRKPCWDLADTEPVVNISWEDAEAYAAWTGKMLPTEAQWEKAAKGGFYFDGNNGTHKNSFPNRRYPWGNQSPSQGGWKANCQNEPEYGERSTSPVGTYTKGASPYGCLDMVGNVWEWCNDWFDESYYHTSPESNPAGPRTGNGKVIRGGAWNSEHAMTTTTCRSWMEVGVWWNVIGFRTAYKL